MAIFKKWFAGWLCVLSVVWLSGCDIASLTEPTATVVVPTATPEPTVEATPEPYSGAGFDGFLAGLEGSLLRDRPGLVTQYMARLPAGPLTDGERAIFIWLGQATSVLVVGDMNNWDVNAGLPLRHIDGTDFWFGEGRYEPTTRLDYKVVVNGTDWRLDPLNPRTIMSGLGPNSELVMPGYVGPTELEPPTRDYPAGTLTQHTLDSDHLNQIRTFFVYQPASQLVGQSLPSVYFHDGGDYLNLINTPAILDRLIAEGDIPPVVAVFVPPINREAEYSRDKAYINFFADELVPFVQETYGTSVEPAQTGTVGVSLGGLVAVSLGVSRPGTFGLSAAYSGAYTLDDDAIILQIGGQSPPPVRLYLVVGTYETAVGGDALAGDLLGGNQRLVQVLESRGYDFRYTEAHEGHSWGLWQGYLGEGLRWLYGE